MLVIGFAVSSVLFLGGFSRQSNVLVAPDVNFGFLSSPRLMAASETQFFVLGGQVSTYRLSIINRNTRQTTAISNSISTLPIDMRFAGGHLFLFFSTSYIVLPVGSLSGDFTLPTSHTLPGVFSTFGLRQTGVNNFNILFAHEQSYSSHTFNTFTNSFSPGPMMSVPFNENIRGIVQDANDTFLFISFQNSNNFEIFRSGHNTPLSNEHFLNPSSIHLAGGTFIFISGNSIVTHNLVSSSTISSQGLPVDFTMHQSYNPISLSFVNSQNIFVLDSHKSSIDRYTLSNNTLTFNSPAFAAQGNELGFLNTPTAMTMVGEGEIVVTDLSPNIRRLSARNDYEQSSWAARGDEFLRATAMAFDNYRTVFASVVQNQENRIITFDQNGVRQAQSWTGFGQISQIFINNATQTVFAINPSSGNILRLEGNSFQVVPLPSTVTITNQTRGAITNSGMVLVNAGGHWTVNGNVATPLVTGLDIVRDVTVDSLGYPILLGILAGAETVVFDGFAPLALVGATITSGNPSLNFDRLNTRLYWLGSRHAVEGVSLGELFSFRDNNAWRYNWQSTTAPVAFGSQLFGQIASGRHAVMFEYPNSINPVRSVAPLTSFIILNNMAPSFEYSLVSFQDTQTQRQHVLYINNMFIVPYPSYYIDNHQNIFCVPSIPENPNVNRLGRVILNGVPIFKYPTSAVHGLHVGTVNKTRSGDSNTVIQVNRRITRTDYRGWEFYEIRINQDGTINRNGAYVGFIYVRHMINYFLAPSIEVSRFRPNTRVTGLAQIFGDSLGQTERTGEQLAVRARVYVRGRINTNQQFTRVYYYDAEMSWVLYGYVETRLLVSMGLGPWQIAGIGIAALGLIAAGILITLHVKKKRAIT